GSSTSRRDCRATMSERRPLSMPLLRVGRPRRRRGGMWLVVVVVVGRGGFLMGLGRGF
ncbi:hypothetical protein LTR66_017773, partial [Elasticomyces elasticus]